MLRAKLQVISVALLAQLAEAVDVANEAANGAAHNIGWTPLQMMVYTYVAAVIGGASAYLYSDKPLSARALVGYMLYHGAAGMIFGSIAYHYLGGKENPAIVIAFAMAVGVGILHIAEIKNILLRVLGQNDVKQN
jgi:FtsH-binding integral membrane protein